MSSAQKYLNQVYAILQRKREELAAHQQLVSQRRKDAKKRELAQRINQIAKDAANSNRTLTDIECKAIDQLLRQFDEL